MPPHAAYDALLAHARTTSLLSSAGALLRGDQETSMPPGGGALRAAPLAELAGLAHARTTAPVVGEWLAACEQDPALLADGDAAANVRGLRRDHDRATR